MMVRQSAGRRLGITGSAFWVAAASIVMIAVSDASHAQSFSLDDNPSTMGGFGLGAEDEFGLSAGPGLAPSPSVGAGILGDGTIFSPTIAGLQHAPNGIYLDAFSTNHNDRQAPIRINFSVDRLTTGIGAVGAESAVSQQMGDIYTSTTSFAGPGTFAGGLAGAGYVGVLPSAGPGGSNTLTIDESGFGLLAGGAVPVPPGIPTGPVGFGTHDNVDAFDWASQMPDPAAPGTPLGVYAAHSYFAVAPDEAVAVGGISAADIFDTAAGAPGTISVPFAGALTLGLDLFGPDSVDALVMFDNNLIGGPANQGPGAEATIDYALFSLAPGSVSLAVSGLSADDVFFTDFSGAFATYAFSTDLGLFPGPGGQPFGGNNIDALEMVPEPTAYAALASLGLIGVGFGVWRRRKK